MNALRIDRALMYLGWVTLITVFGHSFARANPVLFADGVPIEIVGRSGTGEQEVFYLRIGRNLHQVSDCQTLDHLWELTGNSPVPVYDQMESHLREHLGIQQAAGLSCNPDEMADLSADSSVYLENFDTLYFPSGREGQYLKTSTDCAYEFASTLFKSDRPREDGSPSGAEIIELTCDRPESKISHRLYFRSQAQADGKLGYRLVLVQRINDKIRAALSICKVDGNWLADEPELSKSLIEKLDGAFGFDVGARLFPLPRNSIQDNDPCLNVCSGTECTQDMNPMIGHRQALDTAGRSVWLPTGTSTTKYAGCSELLEPFLGPVFDSVVGGNGEWEKAILAGAEIDAQNDVRTFDCQQVRSCSVRLSDASYSLADMNMLVRGDAETLSTVSNDCPEDGSIERIEFVVHGSVNFTASTGDLSIDLTQPTAVSNIAFVGANETKATLNFDFDCASIALNPCPTSGPDALPLFSIDNNDRLEMRGIDIAVGQVSTDLAASRDFTGISVNAVSGQPAWLFLGNSGITGSDDVPLDVGIDARWSSIYCVGCRIEKAKTGVEIVSGRIFVQGEVTAQAAILPKATISVSDTALSAQKSRVITFGGKIQGTKLIHLGENAQAVMNGTFFELNDAETTTGFDVFDVPYLDDGNEATSAMTLRITCTKVHPEQCSLVGIKNGSFEVFAGKNGRVSMSPSYSLYFRTGETIEKVPAELLEAALRCKPEAGGDDNRGYYYRGRNWCGD